MAHPIVYGPAGSTYVWSARLALAEKGVTHDWSKCGLAATGRSPSYRAILSQGLVPTGGEDLIQ